MTLAPPAAEAQAAGMPPLRLPPVLRLTPEQFTLVCAANPEAVLELAADGRLITMPPTGGDTGAHNLSLALGLAARACAEPLKLFDSSTGFRLPDGSVLSPDAAVVRLERWQALTTSDEGPRGAQLGWLLFPEQRAAEIWQAGADAKSLGEPLSIEPAFTLEGGALLPGLRLELAELWEV